MAIERPDGLLVVALSEWAYAVYPINPNAAERFRERHGTSGAKGDARDARPHAYPEHGRCAFPPACGAARGRLGIAADHPDPWEIVTDVTRLANQSHAYLSACLATSEIEYNGCPRSARTRRLASMLHDQMHPEGERQPLEIQSPFPLNQMLSCRANEMSTWEGLWSSVTCTLYRAGYWECAADWHLRERIMPNYILFMCVSGGADFLLGGRPHRLEPGAVLLAPPQVPQEGRHDPTHPLRVYAVHFAARLYGLLDVPILYRLPVTLRPEPAHMALLVEAARRALGEFASGAPGYALAVNAECSRILAMLWREVVAHDPGRLSECWERTDEIARLIPAIQLIQARYTHNLTLQDLAQTVPFHPAYFSTYFKRVVGVSPMRYLTRYRLDRARELLLSTDRTIADIAAVTGHRDASYFGRVFRLAAGARPGEYRKAQRDHTVM